MVLLCVSFIWGVTFTVVKDAISHVDVFIFLFQRFLLAFVLFIPIILFLKKEFNLLTLKYGTILGVLLFSAYAFQTIGLKYTTASNAAFITGVNVIFVPLLNTLIFKREISLSAKIGAVVAWVGLSLLSVGPHLHMNKGDVIVLLCALAVALHIIYTERVTCSHNPVLLAAIQMGVIALFSGITSIFMGEGTSLMRVIPSTLGALLLCAVFASAFAFWAQTYFQRFTSATRTAIIFTAEPLFGALYAHFFGGEALGGFQILGGGLIVGGMIISELGNLDKAK